MAICFLGKKDGGRTPPEQVGQSTLTPVEPVMLGAFVGLEVVYETAVSDSLDVFEGLR